MNRSLTVFVDRDGVLNRKPPEGDYVKHPDELQMLPGAAAAIARLNTAGIRVILVTNQRGIGRGLMTEEDYHAVHDRLCRYLSADGAHLDAEYHCPDTDDSSPCRKPHTGLFVAAIHDFPGIDPADSWVVGDSSADMDAGCQLGCRTIMVGNGSGGDCRADGLPEAVDIIMAALS